MSKGAIITDFIIDVLRCRFTAWMKAVVKRAKIDYLRRIKKRAVEISIYDESLMDRLSYEPVINVDSGDNFAFDDKMVNVVFKKLSPKLRLILELLYVHNLSSEEVTVEMQCSVLHIYNMCSLALNEVRNKYHKENE